MPADEHFMMAPSSMHRWEPDHGCPASIDMCVGQDEETARQAAGTAAHEVLEKCLLIGGPPARWTDDMEMAELVSTMIDTVEDFRNRYAIQKEYVEEKLVPVDSIPWGGTVDYAAVYEAANGQLTLAVMDYKHGGKPVAVKQNLQLGSYAWILKQRHPRIEACHLYIFQPRVDGMVSWVAPLEWLEEVRDKVVRAWGSTFFRVGDCCTQPFACPARHRCPALSRAALCTARMDFSRTASMTDDDLLLLFQQRNAIVAYVKTLGPELLGRIRQGETFDGVKVIESLGNRTWTLEGTELRKELNRVNVPLNMAYRESVISPTQLEKQLESDETFRHLVRRPNLGHVVVNESARGDAIMFETLAEQFLPEDRNGENKS